MMMINQFISISSFSGNEIVRSIQLKLSEGTADEVKISIAEGNDFEIHIHCYTIYSSTIVTQKSKDCNENPSWYKLF